MNVISLGYYPHLIKMVVDKMDIQPGQSILDLGSGTGRNDSFIAQKIGPEGSILGLDISKEMLNLSRKRCQSYPNVKFKEQRIEMPLPYQGEFDKVFIAFVVHGFEDAQKLEIITNAYQALKPRGLFYILDYNEFRLGEAMVSPALGIYPWGVPACFRISQARPKGNALEPRIL